MENRTNAAKELASKFISVDSTIEGPLPADNGKMYMKASFQIADDDDDGFSGQSRAYVKCFFEDSHSLQFQRAQKAMENDAPLKIKGAKITKDLFTGSDDNRVKRYYYVVDEKGKKRKNQDGEDIVSNRLAGFFLSDENPEVYFNNQIKKLTKAGLWVSVEETEPEIE